MNITKEQYIRASERRSDQVKRLNAGTKRCMTLIYILVGISAVFFVLDMISQKIINLVIFLVLCAAAVLVFILMKRSVSDYTVKECHTPATTELSELEGLMNNESYSNDFISKANYLLSAEKDPYARGYIRKLLTFGYFFRGEFDIAFRTNYRDEELFEKDSFYELVYLKNTAFYYFNMPSTTGGTEYGEEAYRKFNELLDSGKVSMKNLPVLNVVLECELNYAMTHGDWQKALDYIDIISISFKNVEQSPHMGVKIEYAQLMLSKAEALFHLGRTAEAKELAFDRAEYLRAFPYQYDRSQQLLRDISEA